MKKNITRHPFPEHNEEWKQFRKLHIGGSEAGAVCGLNDYCSPYSLWAEKTGRVAPFEGNTTTEVGNFLEGFVASQFTKMTGKKVIEPHATFTNDKYPWAAANVDRLVVGEDALLEIKTTSNWEYIKQLKAGEVIPAWYCQMTHYMTVMEIRKAYLAVLVDCREILIREFDFSVTESEALMDAEQEFWGYVQGNSPPPVDGSSATTETIKEIYGSSSGSSIDLGAVGNCIEQYNSISKQIKELERLQDESKNQICLFMGDAEKGSYGAYTVTWKESKRNTFDKEAYEKANGTIPAQYYKTSVSRRFTVTKKKG